MTNLPDLKAMPGLSKELREQLTATFDALSHWRDEVETANERCVGKVLDQTSSLARALGWPDHAIRTTREYLENASKVQMEMIDQIIEGWKGQLKSATAPTGIPRSFADQIPGLGSPLSRAGPEFNPLAPWTFWWQAAEMWQRTWMPETSASRDNRPH
jgi:hypothetical protein